MTHYLARQMKQAPAHRGDFMALPVLAQRGMLEQDEQVVRNHADPEERSVRCELSARHTLHAKTNFEFLDAVLRHLATLAIPDQSGHRRFITVAGDDVVVLRRVIQQFGLAPLVDDDQAKRLGCPVHAVRGFGHCAVGVGLPGRFKDGRDGGKRDRIQPSADGEGLAVGFAVIEDGGL